MDHEVGYFKKSEQRFTETIGKQKAFVDSQELDNAVSKQIELDLWEARYRRGLLYLDMSRFDDAKDDFDTVKFKPKSQGHYGLALLAIAQSDPTKAKDHLENARLKQNNPQQKLRMYCVEGILAMHEMEYRLAERILKEGLYQQRDNPNIGLEHPDTMRTTCLLIELILQEHSVADLRSEDTPYMKNARDFLMDITRTHGQSPVERHREILRSELDLIEGYNEKARNNLEVLIEKADEAKATNSLLIYRVQCNYGVALARLGNAGLAEANLRTALIAQRKVLNPTHPDIFRTRIGLAEVLFHAGAHEEAHEELERVTADLSDHQLTYLYDPRVDDMAAVYERINNKLRSSDEVEFQKQRLACLEAWDKIDDRNNDIQSQIRALKAQLGGGSGQSPGAP
ncbi:MAG: tetratricopeptide repeat protein [Planctomycetota bacterium]|nr:tetratricopeptide repeat protein [Planctomycetota bacterium]